MQSANFREVHLHKKTVLGIGAYGSVCKAQCDDLLCAAKIIHPTLITDFPGKKSPQGRFRVECEFLSTLRHPNVVQYLGVWQDPDTDLPVLLMELMDESLTRFLEKSNSPIPFHTQVNICHDVSLALSFLHSKGIIHRDLSSNNVLMIGDRRAKVTDFGMARLSDLTSTSATRLSLSMCPGTDVYMPPEAVQDPPKYTEKIDCFSFGVLAIQIMTRKFPSPGKRVRSVVIEGRNLLEPQTEYTRRENDMKMVDSSHPLLSMACSCLANEESERPSARDLCLRINGLKEDSQYRNSAEHLVIDAVERLKLEFDSIIKDKNSQIESLMSTIQSKNQMIEAKNAEIADLEERLNSTQKQNIELIKENVQIAAEDIRDVEEGEGGSDKSVLLWTKAADAPCPMHRSFDAVVCGSFVYIKPSSNRSLYVYNTEVDGWTELPHSPTSYCTLANVRNSLVTVGGLLQQDGEKTNKLYDLSTANGSFTWLESYPPMPTKRDSASAAWSGEYLVVAGGIGRSVLSTVELLQVETKEWYTAANLPSVRFSASVAICGDVVCILGGSVFVGTISYTAATCSFRALVNSCRQPINGEKAGVTKSVWTDTTSLPVSMSTCVSFQNQLLAVCGQDRDGDPTRKIWKYESESKSWVEYSECTEARSGCYAAVLPGNKLMVIGGFTGRKSTNETSATERAIMQ